MEAMRIEHNTGEPTDMIMVFWFVNGVDGDSLARVRQGERDITKNMNPHEAVRWLRGNDYRFAPGLFEI
jgi:hypothetical protein